MHYLIRLSYFRFLESVIAVCMYCFTDLVKMTLAFEKANLSDTKGKHVREMYTPLNPNFYIEKLGCAGVNLIFLFVLQNIDCGYSLEPPRRGGSNVYPQSMF